MAYASFDYYRFNFMGESIKDELEFARVELEASAYIDMLTMGKAADDNTEAVKNAVKNAVCAVAEVIAKQARDDMETVTSESVGNHSKSYSKSSKTAIEREEEKHRIAMIFLFRTGLLYRGLK